MKISYLISLVPILLLLSCSSIQENDNERNLTSMDGVIAYIRDDAQQFLVIPTTDDSEIKNKTSSELLELTEEYDNSSYFSVPFEDYDHYQIGDKVSVQYDLNGGVEESFPPIREAVSVTSLE